MFILRHGYTDAKGIRRLFVFGLEEIDVIHKLKTASQSQSSEILVKSMLDKPAYFAFYIVNANNKQYLHFEKDNSISLTKNPTFFLDTDLYYESDSERECTGQQYEKIYMQSEYFRLYGLPKKESYESNELKRMLFEENDSNFKNTIKQDNATLKNTNEQGCYIATHVYGSYDCPQVWTLRRFRDNTLGETWYGRAFIKTYYAISPTLVKCFGESNWFKNLWRSKLDHIIRKLQDDGVESTPYEDKNW